MVEIGDDALGLEAGLEDQDHADEAHHDRQEEERSVADLVHLLDDTALGSRRPCLEA